MAQTEEEKMIEAIGWLGNILLSICGLPQAYKSIKDGHSEGISFFFILLWLFGEVLALVYILLLGIPLYSVIFNYLFNILFLGTISYYKFFPRGA